MRPFWKGALTFGLVTIPASLYSATRSQDLSFRLLHAKDKSRIDYRRYCEAEDVEVPWSDIVKGYEYQKGRFVVLTEEDFKKARVPGTQAFEIRDFVPGGDIDFLYFEQPYYVEPARGGAKAYGLLRNALEETGRVGIGTIVLRQREHLAALKPFGKALVLTTMRFADEITPPRSLDLPADGAGDKRQQALAMQLVESLAATWDPSRYADHYREVLLKAIKQKIAGKPIRVSEPAKPAKVVDLMQALRDSLRATGASSTGTASRRTRARRPAAARRTRRAA
jgi:DNA end-binding protein Ku